MHIKKHLSFAALRAALSEIFEQIEDSRQAGKVDYRLNYQYCRSKFSSRQEYWNNLRVAIRMLFFNDFDHLTNRTARGFIQLPWHSGFFFAGLKPRTTKNSHGY